MTSAPDAGSGDAQQRAASRAATPASGSTTRAQSPVASHRLHHWGDQRLDVGLLLLAAFILIAAGIGLRDPWPADEPRFAMIAKQMVETGSWLIPHRGSELYSDKPPLFMLLEAASFELTKQWRVAFLLPSLLASLGTLGLIYDLARRLWGHRAGLYAAGVLLTTFQFVFQAKRAQIDPCVTFFITLANYGLLRHMLTGPAWRWFHIGCAAAGFGVITKGVGILSALLFVPYLYGRSQRWSFLAPVGPERGRWFAGAAWFLLPVAVWLGPMLFVVWASGNADYRTYVDELLFRQTMDRYRESWDHFQPPWFYLGVVTLSWLPLSLTYPATIPLWFRRLRVHDARFLLPLAWAVMVIAFFSLTAGKRDVYIMPVLPWIAFASGPFLPEIVHRFWLRCSAIAVAVVVGTGLLGTGLILLVAPDAVMWLETNRGIEEAGTGLPWLLTLLGLAAMLPAFALGVRRGVHALVAGLAGLWLLWGLAAYPLLNDALSGAGVMRRVSERLGPDAEIGMVAWKEQEVFLADRPVTEFGFLRPWPQQLSAAIAWQNADPRKRWILILADAMSSCVDPSKADFVGVANRGTWWLFRQDAVDPACLKGAVQDVPEPRTT